MSGVVPVAVECGPVGTWAGAGATVLVVIVTVLVALGYFDAFRRPRLHITFEPAQPSCRYGTTEHEGTALWVRIGVENRGVAPARGCVGRLIAVTTDSELRHDVDPVQLRWAGLPRARAFDPMDLRRDQREYLNVLYAPEESRWELVTSARTAARQGRSTAGSKRRHATSCGRGTASTAPGWPVSLRPRTNDPLAPRSSAGGSRAG